MAYSFKPSAESATAGLRRIAASQIEAGLNELRHDELDRAEKVHQARKRCKKLRGLLRLVRKSFDGYDDENAVFRDAARTLSNIRDRSAVLESLDDLETHFDAELKKAALGPIRKALEAQRAEVDEDEVEERLSDMRLVFREALERTESWTFNDEGPAALSGGLKKTYKRACTAMQNACDDRTPEAFHEWRKRVKYHWYHIRLLRRVWPPVMQGVEAEADALSNDLGEHHDLAVLSDNARAVLGEDSEITELVAGLAASRQATLEQGSLRRGHKLFSDTPSSLAARWTGWWSITASELDN